MITSIEKSVRRILGRTKNADGDLGFLKYNTPPSGRSIGCKVIFFVFLRNDKSPALVAKTVRTYRDAEVIRKGYANVMRLNEITRGTTLAAHFPKMLVLEDDGKEIFTLESGCIGIKTDMPNQIHNILDLYTKFSKLVVSKSSGSITLNLEYAKNIINSFVCSVDVRNSLIRYAEEILSDEIVLPLLPQHGDLTLDNILVNSEGHISIIDCDTFGEVAVPGFDVFHFTRRNKIVDRLKALNDYFRDTKTSHIPDKKLLFIYFLHDLYIKRAYFLVGRSYEDIIKEFDDLMYMYFPKSL